MSFGLHKLIFVQRRTLECSVLKMHFSRIGIVCETMYMLVVHQFE